MGKPELSELPQIEKLLALEELARWFAALSRPLVARIASEAVGKAREALLRPEALAGEVASSAAALEAEIVKRIDAACRQTARRRILRVVNATGVILHTNLGRSPLPASIWKTAEAANCGYSNLELDLATGKRG